MLTKEISHILIVDSSSVTRELLTRMLMEKLPDVEVVACADGDTAQKLLEEKQFDLITTALLLPDIDGLKLCSAIRQHKSYQFTPVIVVSGDANARLLREGFEAGVTDYFDKSKGYKAFGNFIISFVQRNSGMSGRVLFVEDSATAAHFTKKVLVKNNLEVIHTVSAEEAMTILQTEYESKDPKNRIDIVITDFHLIGDMTGGDLVHAIRARFHYTEQELPVLVLTGSDERDTQIAVFRAGANDFVMKPIVEEVMLARVRALLLIKHQFEALKKQTQTMRWIAATDSLTGVRSKRYLLDNGEAYIKSKSRSPVWGVLIDIDHFKKINDTLGHIKGDHVLSEMGDKLNSSFEDSMVVRFGGEEFCILMPTMQRDHALQRAEALRNDFENLKPAGVDVTVSIGVVSTLEFPDENLSDFLGLADKALYAAKENGRNCVYVHSAEGIVRYQG
ncbi:MAG: diguanylate cyclase [Gammaproteobacteria bacterium]|nr:diguanylate cyclase [Gammaproteobacteria bacterium]